MLNLKALEKRLDDALANETKDSLTEWLLQKRMNMLLRALGEEIHEMEVYLPKHASAGNGNPGSPVPDIYEAGLAA